LGRSQDFAGERAWPRPVAKTIFFLLLLTPQGQAKMQTGPVVSAGEKDFL